MPARSAAIATRSKAARSSARSAGVRGGGRYSPLDDGPGRSGSDGQQSGSCSRRRRQRPVIEPEARTTRGRFPVRLRSVAPLGVVCSTSHHRSGAAHARQPPQHRRLRRRALQPRHVRGGPTALGQGEGVHRRRGGADHGRVLPARRGPGRPVELRAGPARAARRREGQGEGQRPVELLPARRRDGPGPEQPRLRLHRCRAGQEPVGVRVPQLRGARHRQHGGAGARRHRRAEGASGSSPCSTARSAPASG